MTESYRVFALTDEGNRIIDINSDAFLADTSEWVHIDEGVGDRYHHAQNNYLPGPKYDERGIPRYKLMNWKAVERTQEEIDADYTPPEVQPTAEELLNAMMEGIANA